MKFKKRFFMLRFAPSPTGDMHIGNLRIAIFNYILAKQCKEPFLIRIEDTDLCRNVEGKDRDILELLNLFGLFWDRLVYQSENFNRYRQFADILLKKNLAFYCYCTKDFLDKKREEALERKEPFRYDDAWSEVQKSQNPNPVIRLRGSLRSVFFKDEIKGELSFNPGELDSFVIIRENGIPTYNFACAIDDMIYDISFIVRGEDHVSNTPKQRLVHEYLDYDVPIRYAHLPIILGDNGKKMSKRDASSSINYLLECGFLPQAIANYLISMGNTTPTEIFTLKEAISWFDIKNISKNPVRFDLARLRFLNREHLKRLSLEDLALLLQTQNLDIAHIARLYLQEASTLNEIRLKINLIFSPKKIYDVYEGRDYSSLCLKLLDSLRKILDMDYKNMSYEEFKQHALTLSSLRGKEFFKPLRILLTGLSQGLELESIFPYLSPYLPEILEIES